MVDEYIKLLECKCEALEKLLAAKEALIKKDDELICAMRKRHEAMLKRVEILEKELNER